MSRANIEQRLTTLERELAALRETVSGEKEPWWKRTWVNTPEDIAAMDEADRLGREWRESFRPKNAPSMIAKAKAVRQAAAKPKVKAVVKKAKPKK